MELRLNKIDLLQNREYSDLKLEKFQQARNIKSCFDL